MIPMDHCNILAARGHTDSPTTSRASLHQEAEAEEWEHPSEQMRKRWELRLLELPSVDQVDIMQLQGNSRQFSAEFAQQTYLHMLRLDKPVGNYL